MNFSNPVSNSNDRLFLAGLYVLSPILPGITYFVDSWKAKPGVKDHLAQSLILGIAVYVLSAILSPVLIGCAVAPLGILVELYYGYKVYQGEPFVIPVLTEFVKQQGW